ncbi:hypothetical protein DMC30DRAFT_426567 [Rhodotorula diobovata]|uniref:PHD-type domain-containing protein n=1 Tax=Rhodotorula diobovata TaxID=5288 RepID=A0A5C5FNM0_9BASI|nr:hypothetical protein DMC30DRAFT_426567 [Rhodotorula diobovata]
MPQGQQQNLQEDLNFEENLGDIPEALYDPNNGAAAAAAAAAAAPLPGPQPHINNFPSVLSQAPPAPQFAPAPGIPVNMAPQNMPALPQPLNPDGSQPPPKRPRGRPRKVPGTENRSTPAAGAAGGAGAGADASGRGRPKARGRGRGRGGRGRGRGGKRARVSSDEEDYGPDLASSSDAEGEEDDAEKSVDLNQEVDDDFGGKVGPTTKFGRKISKPKSFVPTNKPTIQRKKRAPQVINLDANLMCEVCHLGHSPPENRLVICEACNKGWHQLCAIPPIEASVVDSILPWFCSDCDAKIAATKAPLDVSTGAEEWTTGKGEDKGAGKEGDKEAEYADEVKKEWLEGLPLHTLVGYILSVEKTFAPQLTSETGSSTSLPIWPLALPATLEEAKQARIREEAERAAALERQAEELAAAAAAAASAAATPSASEAGSTHLGFDPLPGDAPARTAASRRAEVEALAHAALQPPQHQGQPVAGPSGTAPQQQGYGSPAPPQQQHAQQQQQQQQRNAVPAFLRQPFQTVPALGDGSASPQAHAFAGASPTAAAAGGDIPVGGAAQQAARYAAYNPQAQAQAQAQQQPGGAVGGYGAYGAYGATAVQQQQQQQQQPQPGAYALYGAPLSANGVGGQGALGGYGTPQGGAGMGRDPSGGQ